MFYFILAFATCGLDSMIFTSPKIPTSTFEQRYLKLHGADAIKNFSHVFTDLGPGDLVIALRCGLDSMPGQVIKSYHIGQDPHGLIEGTEPGRERERQGDNVRNN